MTAFRQTYYDALMFTFPVSVAITLVFIGRGIAVGWH